MLLPMDGDEASGWKPGKPTPFLNTPATEIVPAFSPDGRWIAYVSIESGRSEVYVRPFPGPGGKWQISTAGGTYPVWSPARKELLYATPDNRIMAVPYAAQVVVREEEPPVELPSLGIAGAAPTGSGATTWAALAALAGAVALGLARACRSGS